MAKTIKKQIFTEDLSKYRHFLEASDVNIKASIQTMQQEIYMHKKICALIKKYQKTGEATKDDFQALSCISCPDFITLNTFEKLNAGAVQSFDELFDMPAEEVVMDCSKTKCEVCWKNYINQMARCLNQSFVDIKLYEKKEDDDGDPDSEN